MGKRITVSWLALLALAWLQASAHAAEPIRIGAIFSVTGPASFLGSRSGTRPRCWRSSSTATAASSGKVEVIVYDDESDTTKAVTAADRLLKRDRVVAVIGPSTSGSTLAIVPKIEEAKDPAHLLRRGQEDRGPGQALGLQDAAERCPGGEKDPPARKERRDQQDRHPHRLGRVRSAGREELKELAGPAGMTIVSDEVFGPKDTDMTAQLTRIKGTAAQAIVAWGTNRAGRRRANRVQLKIGLPLYMSHGVASPKFIELAGPENAEGILLPAGRLIAEGQVPSGHPQKTILANYTKEYEARFKQPISTFGGYAWDAIMLVAQAVKRAQSAEPAAIRDALEATRGFWGTTGEYNFSAEDHAGLTEDAFVMVRITKGTWEMLR